MQPTDVDHAVPATDIDQMFAALADPARRGVIDLLRKKPYRAGELAAALSISPARMSQHLRVLRSTGLIEDDGLEYDARVKLYRLRPEPFSALRGWLDEVEAFWSAQLSAFKAHAESRGLKQSPTHHSPTRNAKQAKTPGTPGKGRK